MMEYMWAFLVGGIICAIGQVLIDITTLTAPRILVTFVVLGVVLESMGLYQPLVDLAGPGATVPLPGFGYAMAKSAMEGANKGILEAISGPFTSVSAGLAVDVFFGYIVAMTFSPKSPNSFLHLQNTPNLSI